MFKLLDDHCGSNLRNSKTVKTRVKLHSKNTLTRGELSLGNQTYPSSTFSGGKFSSHEVAIAISAPRAANDMFVTSDLSVVYR